MSGGRPGLSILPGSYAVCRLPPGTEVEVRDGELFALTRTRNETSVVCREEDAPAGSLVEGDWRALVVAGPLPFDAIGILASLATPLAEARVPIFVVSTYDTDYLLVPGERLQVAMRTLGAAGFEITGP